MAHFRPHALALLAALSVSIALPARAVQTPEAPPLSAPAAPPWQGKLTKCTLPGAGEAYCGSYEVFENRTTQSGRKIALRIAVLPALGPDRAPDPVFFLEGGPGGAAIPDAEIFAKDPLRRRRDIVLVDFRGTGGSNPLTCPLWGDGTRLDKIFPLDAVATCRDRLKKKADLTQYTTPNSVDDLDEVRRHLGYDKINLYGASYGTFAAQIYLARHPRSVRSVVLSAVARPGEASPLYHARNAQQALELLARQCDREAACKRAFPRFRDEVAAVLDRLAKSPAKVQVKHPKSGKNVTVTLTRSAAADAIRWALYSPGPASQVPLRIHQAFEGNYGEIAQAAVRQRAQLQEYLALGVLFSVTCSEDLPLIDVPAIPEATRGSFYGEDRVRDQLAACAIWPHAPLPNPWGQLVKSNLPVLLLAGERDPVTPPADAHYVATGFTNGRLLLIPNGAHSNDNACLTGLIADFVERGTTRTLDLSCLEAEPATPFVLEVKKEATGGR